jgi:glutathione gamma-glutamylcysteinyltransferase
MPEQGFYRRPLPSDLPAFSSGEGRRLFREALDAGGMEGWFALAEQFHTQSDPAFCGLGTLVVVLNALEVDPGRVWKGPWRWYGEELLDCCLPLERIRERGVTIDELACLARCNGARARVVRADEASVDAFRDAVRVAAAAPRGPILVASYDRAQLGQTGSGHFSPLAGYHAERDLVLILDVARFKYPPHWVSLPALHRAMQELDPATGRARGFVVLERSALPVALFFRLALQTDVGAVRHLLLEEVPTLLFSRETCASQAFVETQARACACIGPLPSSLNELLGEHQALVDELLASLRGTAAYAYVQTTTASPTSLPMCNEVLAMLLLALPDTAIGDDRVREMRALDPTSLLGREVAALREQLTMLRRWAPAASD